MPARSLRTSLQIAVPSFLLFFAGTCSDSGTTPDPVEVIVPRPDLQVTKSVLNTPIAEGDTVQFEIQVKHMGGDSPATGIRVQDVLPTGLSFVSEVLSQGTFDDATSIWTVGNLLSVNDVATMTLTATAGEGTTGSSLINNAILLDVDQGDSISSNNSASDSVSVEGVDISVAQSFTPGTYTDGDILEFQVVMGLNGRIPATNIQIMEAIPSGTGFVSATSTNGTYDVATGMWTLPTKAPGSPADTLRLKVEIFGGSTSVSNTAQLFGVDQRDTNPSNDAADVTIPVHKADVAITKTAGASSISEGESVTFTITVTNVDPYVRAIDTTVGDYVPAYLLSSHAVSQGTYDPVDGKWLVGTLAVGASATLQLTVQTHLNWQGVPLTNTANVIGSWNGDTNPANNEASATVTVLGDLSPSGTPR